MDKIEQYIEEHLRVGSPADAALLAELDRATNLRVIQPKMVSGPVQGAFLTLITKMLRPRLVLEIGTFSGYSALSIAAGLEDGGMSAELVSGEALARRQTCEESPESGETGWVSGDLHPQQEPQLHTVEIDDELEELAGSFFDRSPHGRKIRLHIGSALEVVPRLARQLGRPFDMVFIDGDKREYPDYYRMLMGDSGTPPMVASGSVILTDNVLWYGKVVDPGLSYAGSAGRRTGEQTGMKAGEQTSDRSDKNSGSNPGGPASERPTDKHTAGIVEFNRMVSADPRVESVILPLRDGINLIRVR
jgi:caffeoyl-CoA O-methyltransferase